MQKPEDGREGEGEALEDQNEGGHNECSDDAKGRPPLDGIGGRQRQGVCRENKEEEGQSRQINARRCGTLGRWEGKRKANE